MGPRPLIRGEARRVRPNPLDPLYSVLQFLKGLFTETPQIIHKILQ